MTTTEQYANDRVCTPSDVWAAFIAAAAAFVGLLIL